MASAKLTQMQRQVVSYVTEEAVVLNLSREEAETLMIITHSIGGGESGRRGHNTAIQRALVSAGIRRQEEHPDKASGGIWFKDTITAR